MGCVHSRQAVMDRYIDTWDKVCQKNEQIRQANERQRANARNRCLPGWSLPVGPDPIDPPRPRF